MQTVTVFEPRWLLTWERYRLSLTGVFLCFSAFGVNFSISVNQAFLAAALLVWILDSVILAWARRKYPLCPYVAEYPKSSWLPIMSLFSAYVVMRILHITASTRIPAELMASKETLLFLALPLVLYRLPQKRWFFRFMFSWLLGGAITGAYSFYKSALTGFDLFAYHGGAFHANNQITFAGTMGITFLVGAGYLIHLIRQEKSLRASLIGLLLAMVLSGFIIARARWPYVSMTLVMIIVLFIVYPRFFWLVAPLILIIPALILGGEGPLQRLFSDFNDSTLEGISLAERADLWAAGFRMYLDRPLFGLGEVDFLNFLPRYIADHVTLGRVTDMYSDPLQALVSFGTFGLVLYLSFIVLPVSEFIRQSVLRSESRKHKQDPFYGRYFIALGSLAAIILFFLMGLTQCHFADDEVVYSLWVAIAVMYRVMPPKPVTVFLQKKK